MKVDVPKKAKAIDDKTLTFLEKYEQNFFSIKTDSMLAIQSFCILWMLFENKIFRTTSPADEIRIIVKEWSKKDQLKDTFWLKDFGYFKDRYFKDGKITNKFKNLRLRTKTDKKDPLLVVDSLFVQEVLKGIRNRPEDTLIATLLIVLRFRNNLFHGSKWPAGMTNQKENFDTCSNILRLCLERFVYNAKTN